MTHTTSASISDSAELALHGGPKAVTASTADRWPRVQQEETDLVAELMRRGEISLVQGGMIPQFEEAFARYIGSRYCLAVNNGTNGLFSAYFAANVGPGDEVIVPSYTWHATVAPIIHCGAVPVFCEVSPENLCADPDDIERKITPKTRAIAVTHLWGNVADMDRIMEISRRFGIPVIEDASHAHGAEWCGHKAGSIGAIGVFSLQGSKPLSGGEAGAVVTDNPEYYDRMLVLGHHGRDFSEMLTGDTYRHLAPQGVGFKFRAHPLALAIAMVQLKRLDEVNRRRAEVWACYDRGLAGCPGIQSFPPLQKARRAGFYEYRMLYKPEELGGLPLEAFLEQLRAEGVPADRDRYNLAHLHPFFSRDWGELDMGFLRCEGTQSRKWAQGDLPVTESIHSNLLGLPSYTDPEPGLLDQITGAFRKVAQAAVR